MEHLAHFGLPLDPFVNDPLMQFYFAGPQHSDAERRLLRGVQQGKSLCTLVGEVGTGKTMVVRHLLEGLEEEQYEASLLVMLHGAQKPGWMLTRIAQQLGVEEPATERSALVGQVYERLAIVREDGRQTVVLIDEAQMLATRDALEELRGLLNLEYEERHLVSVVLVGLPALGELLALDPPLAQRAEIKVRLSPLDLESGAAYLAHRIRTVKGDPAILEPAAVTAVCRWSGGIPRRINTLADNSLYEAFLAGRSRVAEADVRRAATDLGLALDNGGVASAAVPAAPGPDLAATTASVAPVLAAPSAPGEPPSLASAAAAPAFAPAPPIAAPASPHVPLSRPAPARVAAAPVAPEADELDAQLLEPTELDEVPYEEAPVFEALDAEVAVDFPSDGPPKDADDVDDLFADLVKP